jgi:hypothetical protein
MADDVKDILRKMAPEVIARVIAERKEPDSLKKARDKAEKAYEAAEEADKAVQAEVEKVLYAEVKNAEEVLANVDTDTLVDAATDLGIIAPGGIVAWPCWHWYRIGCWHWYYIGGCWRWYHIGPCHWYHIGPCYYPIYLIAEQPGLVDPGPVVVNPGRPIEGAQQPDPAVVQQWVIQALKNPEVANKLMENKQFRSLMKKLKEEE